MATLPRYGLIETLALTPVPVIAQDDHFPVEIVEDDLTLTYTVNLAGLTPRDTKVSVLYGLLVIGMTLQGNTPVHLTHYWREFELPASVKHQQPSIQVAGDTLQVKFTKQQNVILNWIAKLS